MESDVGSQLLRDQSFLRSLREALFSPSLQHNLTQTVTEICHILTDLIRTQIETELNDIVSDNNRILRDIQAAVSARPPTDMSIAEETSFGEVHRIINEERRKINSEGNHLEESGASVVELKVETMEEVVGALEKRVKQMEDKYETNLKSIWNVLSITEGKVHQHLKQCKLARRRDSGEEGQGKKQSVFGFLKFGK